MKTSLFDYNLPEDLIAQKPIEPRHSSKLMVIDRKTGKIEHKKFHNLLEILDEGDCLVINETKVFPGRLIGYKEVSGGKVELLLLKEADNNRWEVLSKPSKKLKKGNRITFKNGQLRAVIKEELSDGKKIVSFSVTGKEFWQYLKKIGKIPLPPYIKNINIKRQRYQTVFAKDEHSIASPTAGLHFTEEMLDDLMKEGINICPVTLDIGIDTFLPVREENIEDHKIHSERYRLSKEAARIINDTKKMNKRVVAVGTTSTRLLETVAKEDGTVAPGTGLTSLFIFPGYKYKTVDMLLTNFHLPKSSLIMMVSAFAGLDLIRKAYSMAIKERYYFYSFGDAMLII